MHIFYFKEKLHRDTKKYRFYYTTQIAIKYNRDIISNKNKSSRKRVTFKKATVLQ